MRSWDLPEEPEKPQWPDKESRLEDKSLGGVGGGGTLISLDTNQKKRKEESLALDMSNAHTQTDPT